MDSGDKYNKRTNLLVVIFVQHHPLKVQVEPVSLFGLYQPVAAQVVPAAVVADGRRRWRQYPAHRGVTDPSSAGHGCTHVSTHPLLSRPPEPVGHDATAALALTDALRFRGAPVRPRGVDAGRHLVAAHLEARVTVEVGLTSRVDVCHRHAALLGRPGEWARQQEGCVMIRRRKIS